MASSDSQGHRVLRFAVTPFQSQCQQLGKFRRLPADYLELCVRSCFEAEQATGAKGETEIITRKAHRCRDT